MISRVLILLSTICILYIAMEDTISRIAFDNDIIELMEKTEQEEKEKEFQEEWEFIHDDDDSHLMALSAENILHCLFFKAAKYRSPVQHVLTPPPNLIA